MNLINIDNAEAAPAGHEAYIVPEIPDMVNAAVGSSVNFQNIQAAPLCDFLTNIFMRIKIDLGASCGIERFGKNAGSRSFSGTSRPYKEIGMCEATMLNGIFQRLDDVILPKDIIECQGTIFSGKDLVTHGSGRLKEVSLFEKEIERNCFKMLISGCLCGPLYVGLMKKISRKRVGCHFDVEI